MLAPPGPPWSHTSSGADALPSCTARRQRHDPPPHTHTHTFAAAAAAGCRPCRGSGDWGMHSPIAAAAAAAGCRPCRGSGDWGLHSPIAAAAAAAAGNTPAPESTRRICQKWIQKSVRRRERAARSAHRLLSLVSFTVTNPAQSPLTP